MNLLKRIKILSETIVIYFQPKPSVFVNISKDFTLEILTRLQPVHSEAIHGTGAEERVNFQTCQ